MALNTPIGTFALPGISVTLLALTSVCGGEIAELVVDCSKPVGVIRPLHSSNGGPIAWGGMVDLSGRHRELGFPYLRLHDCQWPEPAVVDVHPPRDYDKWVAVCVGIIRHYNEGWAEGFRHGINYWEIWNEPDVRPQMWSDTDDDYYLNPA